MTTPATTPGAGVEIVTACRQVRPLGGDESIIVASADDRRGDRFAELDILLDARAGDFSGPGDHLIALLMMRERLIERGGL